MSDDTEEFFIRHCSMPGGVVLAIAPKVNSREVRHGIFSSLDKAKAWSDTLDADEYQGCVFVPYIIDEPNYGNVPKERRQ